jgi:hypothetical protein
MPAWDAKTGCDAGITWAIYGDDCVDIKFKPPPMMTAKQLADLILRLSYINKAMSELDNK